MPYQSDLFEEIDRSGFFPELTRSMVAEAIGEEPILATIMQNETTFEFETLRRHTTIVCLLAHTLILIHIDDHEGRAFTTTSYIRLERINNFLVTYGVADPSNPQGGAIDEVTLQINWGEVRRSETEPATCGDPQCRNDHGFTTTTMPDDLVMRVSAAAEGPEAVANTRNFARILRSLLLSLSGTRA